MTSTKQIIANRKNALKSTGPRTPRGKDIASRNALRHGLNSKRLLLPDECQDLLDEFHAQLRIQLAPVGNMEILLAERIIAAAWRLQRLLRIETEMMTEDLQQKTPKWQLPIFGSENQPKTLGSAVARTLRRPDT